MTPFRRVLWPPLPHSIKHKDQRAWIHVDSRSKIVSNCSGRLFRKVIQPPGAEALRTDIVMMRRRPDHVGVDLNFEYCARG
jgi:hypothetical protein